MTEINFNNLPEAVGLLLQKIENLENLMQVKQSPVVVECDRLNINEAEDVTGYSKSTLYKGKVPCKKMGKKLVFSRKELIAWMESQTIGPVSNKSNVLNAIVESATKKANL